MLVGVGSLALLTLASWIYREEIAEQYHFVRMLRDPNHLGSIIDQPDGSSARAAVLRFLETDVGKGALILLCMPDPLRTQLAGWAAARVYVVWSSDNRTACFSIERGVGGVQGREWVSATQSLPSARVRWIRDLFATGQVFSDVPGHPGAIFEVAGANVSGSAPSRSKPGMPENP